LLALYLLKRRKANWICHVLRRNRLVKHFIRKKLGEEEEEDDVSS